MKILTNSQGKPLLSSQGKAYQAPDYLPATLEVKSTTVQYDATHTENVASNDNIRILGSDNKRYTLAQWNAMFVAAGFDKAQMPVTPKGLSVDAFDHRGECYLFDRYTGQVYNPVGDSQANEGLLQHSSNNGALVTEAVSGTDYITGKAWSVTANGDNLTLYEANTGQSWVINKDTGAAPNSHKAYNIHERTYSLWAQNEWMRHRMAISSGVTTSKADGTMGEIAIYNSSGVQAAVNEDMYFWIKNDSDVWVNTNILAKYNLNNKHNTNSASLTSAIRDAIYARQIANGINMNDTGVNSASKPILAPGSKGAEIIAVNGAWMIITPFIGSPSATITTAAANMADAPAVYWAVNNNHALPSDTILFALYINKTLATAAINYLKNREAWSIPTIPISTSIWTALCYNGTYTWSPNYNVGSVGYTSPSTRYYTVGSIIIPE